MTFQAENQKRFRRTYSNIQSHKETQSRYYFINIFSLLSIILLLTFAAISSPAHALYFRKVGEEIHVSGQFVEGDSKRLSRFLKSMRATRDERIIDFTASLNSPGGNLFEGFLIGRVFRENAIATLVKRNNECLSACALAFLGGTQRYTTGRGVGRNLEVGAKLGFHGFSSKHEQVILLNEALDVARVVNGLILEYANGMGKIDLALLSELISVAPNSMSYISTPHELNGLGIEIRGALPPLPKSWGLNVCKLEVDRIRPRIDGALDGRISHESKLSIINSLSQLRQQILALYSEDPAVQQALSMLPPDELLIVLGRIYWPIFPVHRFEVVRGAGLYYDYCYAIQSKSSSNHFYTMLLSHTGGFKSKYYGPLAGYSYYQSLW